MIKLENINKTYDNGSPLHVLKGIDLTVEKGELVSIMGASGSGKSTPSKTSPCRSIIRASPAASATPSPSNTSTCWA